MTVSEKPGRADVYRTFLMPSSLGQRPTECRLSVNSEAMESEGLCTKLPTFPIMAPPGRGLKLQPGLVVAIEPIFCMGKPDVIVAEDGWTTSTRDGTTVAHFEHTVAVTKDGPDVLTLPSADCRSAP